MENTVAVVVITKNEEKNIRDCLESAKWADEIVVLDDESSDQTVDFARKYTDKIYHRKMDIEGKHRNEAYAKASTRWVLSLDADERITKALAEEIRALLKRKTDCVAYAIPIKAFIGDRWIQGAGYYPARKVRLFQREKFRYEEARVHPRVFIDGKCGELHGDILHYSYQNFSDFLTKFNRETTLEAEKWFLDRRRVTPMKMLRKAVSRFLKFYFQKQGMRHGFLGFVFSFFHALYQIISYAKYWERQELTKHAPDAS